MSKKPAIHTVKDGDQWINRTEGSDRGFAPAPTKAEAQAAGRESAQRRGVEHVIHKVDGKIGEKNSYGNDPPPPSRG
ncbi:MAG: DUF2188 domain-containing protein [Solirubrobacteraceae bacterium]